MVILNTVGINDVVNVSDGNHPQFAFAERTIGNQLMSTEEIRRMMNGEFDGDASNMETINPARYSIDQLCFVLMSVPNRSCKSMVDMYMRYTLNIYGLPPCPEEDLMLAVYFFFEEKINMKCTMLKCFTYKVQRVGRGLREQVGVVFDKIQTVDSILRRCDIALKNSTIKVKANKNPELIMQLFSWSDGGRI